MNTNFMKSNIYIESIFRGKSALTNPLDTIDGHGLIKTLRINFN